MLVLIKLVNMRLAQYLPQESKWSSCDLQCLSGMCSSPEPASGLLITTTWVMTSWMKSLFPHFTSPPFGLSPLQWKQQTPRICISLVQSQNSPGQPCPRWGRESTALVLLWWGNICALSAGRTAGPFLGHFPGISNQGEVCGLAEMAFCFSDKSGVCEALWEPNSHWQRAPVPSPVLVKGRHWCWAFLSVLSR